MAERDPQWTAMTAAQLAAEVRRAATEVLRRRGEQAKAARALGVHPSTLMRVRQGRGQLRPEWATKLDEEYPGHLGEGRSFAQLIELLQEAELHEAVPPSASAAFDRPLRAEEAYAVAAALLRSFRPHGPQDVVRHASLHGHGGPRYEDLHDGQVPTAAPTTAEEFDAAFDELVIGRHASCAVRFLVTVAHRKRFDRVIERLARYQEAPRFEARAVVASDSLPMIVPLIIGDHVLLAIDDQRMYRVDEAIHLSGRGVARWAASYFDMLWDDSRCIRIRPPSGLDHSAIRLLRDRLDD